ncbi:LacI family DNA-binding transcriptional regulator [Paracraurococcus lichenis]|uniref:LacI family DNA-binding transcriptional regulator n=1 Tax=Paracraurococcus lichenis TaxID=3064888 RepID=A0ABT9E6I3_9PROT|nr:LacI family DNA-binding transcriptional regulator [Paracraurococcus sp. LOR1-02]MDO9711790.1 LacI family DNA-binding transcriptional regulator [Paracraurococcus sp. LOR1-02]
MAEAAGVHVSTASRALKPDTRHLVADAVVARVLAEAKRLGYHPDATAAALRTGRSRLIGALVPGIANPVFAPILAGAEAVLAAHGYALLVADPGDDPARALALADSMGSRRVDGLLLATATERDDPVVTHCLARGTPVVLINRTEAAARVPAVVPDDAGGLRLAVEHLVALGHRRIGHVGGPIGLTTGTRRRLGFVGVMVEHGLDASAVESSMAYTREAGAVASARLLARRPDLTALACANDLLALGAYDTLAGLSRTVPRDVSVTGHNDMPLVDMVAPPLTTVRIGHAEMGQEGARLLLRAIEDRTAIPPGCTTLLRPEIVVRASTAPPSATDPA